MRCTESYALKYLTLSFILRSIIQPPPAVYFLAAGAILPFWNKVINHKKLLVSTELSPSLSYLISLLLFILRSSYYNTKHGFVFQDTLPGSLCQCFTLLGKVSNPLPVLPFDLSSYNSKTLQGSWFIVFSFIVTPSEMQSAGRSQRKTWNLHSRVF